MQFIYEIASFPSKTTGYNLTAFTEGRLQVVQGPSLFLDAQGILLVEFAVVMNKWLLAQSTGHVGLYYASMDFEEEPVFALRFDSDLDCFIPESVWAQADAIPVSGVEAEQAAKTFLARLSQELRAKHDVDLEGVFKKS